MMSKRDKEKQLREGEKEEKRHYDDMQKMITC